MRLTSELMAALDEAVELVELPPETDQEDIQLRMDNQEPPSDLPEETPETINDREEVDEDLMDVDENLGSAKPEGESGYPTPPPSIHITDISVPVRSEGVRMIESTFAIQQDETIPDLPSPPDIEPALIDEMKRQQTERFYDYHQLRVPQVWHMAFQAGRYHKRDVPHQKIIEN